MVRVYSVRILLLVVFCLAFTGCGGGVLVPVPPVQQSMSTPSAVDQGSDAAQAPETGVNSTPISETTELLGAIVTSADADAPDFAALAPASDAGITIHPTPDFDHMANLMNGVTASPQLLSDRQRRRGNTLYEALQTGVDAFFVLQTARCSFDTAQGFALYQGSYVERGSQAVQSDIRGQLQKMYFRVHGGGLNVDVSLGGGPAQVLLQSDGTVRFGWQGQSSIGTQQIIGLVGDDQMALAFESDTTSSRNGALGSSTASGRLLCPMAWLAQADWPPLPPYNVQIQSTPQRCLIVSWQPNTAGGVSPAKYIVSRYLSDDRGFREIASVTTNYYQDCSQEAINESLVAHYYVIAVSRNNSRSIPSDSNSIQLIDRSLPSWGN